MSNSDKSLQIVFNGEIFNYKEIKKDLLKKDIHSNQIQIPKF